MINKNINLNISIDFHTVKLQMLFSRNNNFALGISDSNESSRTETLSSFFLMIIKFKDLNYLIKCIEMYHIISVYIFLSLLVLL